MFLATELVMASTSNTDQKDANDSPLPCLDQLRLPNVFTLQQMAEMGQVLSGVSPEDALKIVEDDRKQFHRDDLAVACEVEPVDSELLNRSPLHACLDVVFPPVLSNIVASYDPAGEFK